MLPGGTDFGLFEFLAHNPQNLTGSPDLFYCRFTTRTFDEAIFWTLFVMVSASSMAFAGPPFRRTIRSRSTTRIRVLHVCNSEYAAGEVDAEGPAIEFNWGAMPNVHLHMIIPVASYFS